MRNRTCVRACEKEIKKKERERLAIILGSPWRDKMHCWTDIEESHGISWRFVAFRCDQNLAARHKRRRDARVKHVFGNDVSEIIIGFHGRARAGPISRDANCRQSADTRALSPVVTPMNQ